MKVQLHDACRERLIACVENGLREVKFRNQYILDYSSFRFLEACSPVLPRDILGLASKWISADPLRDFSYGFVADNRSLYSEQLQKLTKEDFPVNLSDIVDVAQISAQIIDSFSTLPWEYTVVLPFVSTAGSDFESKSLSLSKGFAMKISSELRHPFPANPGLLLFPWEDADWQSDRLYLEATLEGYVGFQSSTETLEQFFSQARAVAGIGLAVNAFNLSYRDPILSYLYPGASFKPLYIFRSQEGVETKAGAQHVPGSIGALDQLELNHKNSDFALLLPIAFGESDECSRLREAGQWHFASMTEKNEIFEFVEAVVALEILFNDKATAAEVGIDTLIANRCAYLVARSTTERTEIIKVLKEIYEARSQIVHKGKARLSKAERSLLFKARELGGASISKELAMIFRSQPKKAALSQGIS